MGVEVPQFEMEHGIADYTEAEMPRLNDAGVYGTDRHFANPVSLHSEEVVLAFRPRHMRSIVDHGMDVFRPILVEQQRPRVRVPFALDAVLVMEFAFVPGGRGHDRRCRRNGSGDRRTEHSVFAAVHLDEVVNVAYVVIIGAAKNGDQPRVLGAQQIQCLCYTRLAVGKDRCHGCNTAIAPRKTAANTAGICMPNTTRHTAQMPITTNQEACKAGCAGTSSDLPMSMC